MIIWYAQMFCNLEVLGQSFTSNSNGDWTTNSSTRWIRTNPSSCATQYPSPPLTNPSNISCAIDVIINHSITKTGNNQFAQRFRSLKINSSGYLNFTGNSSIEFTNNSYGAVDIVIDGGTLELYNMNLVNGATVKVINGGKLIVRNNLTTSGSSTQITVDASSSISVTNDATIASGHILNISGTFTSKNFISNSAITTIASTAIVSVSNDFNLNSSGSLNISGDAKLTVGRDLNSSGSATLTSNNNSNINVGGNFTNSSSGNFNFNNNSELKVSGNFVNQQAGTIRFSNDSELGVTGNLVNSNGSFYADGNIGIAIGGDLTQSSGQTFGIANNVDLAVGGSFFLQNGTLQSYGSSQIEVAGNANQSGGTLSSNEFSDIRINGNLTSTGGTFNGSGSSFLGVNGNHTVTNYNSLYNLSNNAQIQVQGTTSSPWNTLNVYDNACYKSSTTAKGDACVLCGETYTMDGTFYVPAGVTQITIEVWGGGGAGGSGPTKTGGGGGGGYSRRIIDVTPGQPLAVYVGKGGVGTSSVQTTRDGSISYVSINSSEPLPNRITNSLIFANGGKSPNPVTGLGTGGAALTASDLASRPNSVSYKGGDGRAPGNASGGGGSAAADNGPGNNGQDPNGGVQPGGKGGPGGAGNFYNNNGNQPPSGTYAGGGGGAYGITGSNKFGGNGAGGLVVISFTCPNITPCSRVVNYGINGDYYIVEYFCDGIWAAPEGLVEYEVMLVGGGGAGGRTDDTQDGQAGGGGGGGAVVFPPKFTIPGSGIPSGANYDIKVGKGGDGNATSTTQRNGGNSSFNNGVEYIAGGGGGGGLSNIANQIGINGQNNSSGGGGGAQRSNSYGVGGTGNGIGKNGGAGKSTGSEQNQFGGGGGGAGETGFSENASDGGIGGKGLLSSFNGVSKNYAAGGGGGSASRNKFGSGGAGGGGKGGRPNENPENGLANTGSGGGGAGGKNKPGGNGGSGIVIIRYPVFKILPVEFLYFNATYLKEDNSGILEWSTSQEWENSHFEIERAIHSVKEWEAIGSVEGKGYSDTPMEYNFTDSNLPISGGNIFYRLKQVDYSGKFSYSKTKAIQILATEGNSAWIAYPNPSQLGSEIRIELLQPKQYQDEPISISLINMLGDGESKVLTSPEEVSRMVSDWMRYKNAGLYILDIRWGNNSEQIKLLKN